MCDEWRRTADGLYDAGEHYGEDVERWFYGGDDRRVLGYDIDYFGGGVESRRKPRCSVPLSDCRGASQWRPRHTRLFDKVTVSLF